MERGRREKMELVKITDLTARMHISSRSLRYYEQVGLIRSVRPDGEKYRYYETETIERLQQILVLRKMQIPIKDILRIYESEDMSVVVEAFVDRLHAIDEEMTALSELKRIVNDFLHTMMKNGINRISALPLLYEEMDKQLEILEEHPPLTYERLAAASERVEGAVQCDILELPPMRMLTSRRREDGGSDVDGFWDWLSSTKIPPGRPGQHTLLEYQNETGQTVVLQRVDDAFVNDGPFEETAFAGGLFALGGVYADEDIGAFHRRMIGSFDDNPYYQVDYRHDGGLRQETLAEAVLSPDEKREKLHLFLAVKKRLPAVSRDDGFRRIDWLTAAEIEEANSILWTMDVPPDRLLPEPPWSYHVNDRREGEYIPVIDTHYLSTGVSVRLPFRVELEFRIDNTTAAFGYGADEGNLCFQHGTALFGFNKGNYASRQEEAVVFDQPVFGNRYTFPGIGGVSCDTYHQLIWIVGEKHFAVILDGEVRFCGNHFPYMAADWQALPSQTIRITANGSARRVLRAVRVSQLKTTPKRIIKEGALTMNARPSNNTIPVLHRVITSDHGENYWFNGCAGYVMECCGEPDYDYWFFAGLTGDNFAQNYALNGGFLGDGVVDFLLSNGTVAPADYFEGLFEKCGYACTYVDGKALRKNIGLYLRTLTATIDKGLPVILYGVGGPPFGVIVGYEEHGRVLLYMTGDQTEPRRLSVEEAVGREETARLGWIFVGEKTEQKDLKQQYRDVIQHLAELLTVKTDTYCFGAEAFRAWAADIEGGRFDGMKPEDFDGWCMYTTYVCCLATNSGGCRGFLEKAQALNPDLTFLEEVRRQYRITGLLWNAGESGDGFAEEYAREIGETPDSLEAVGGGFNITLEALQNPEKRARIVAVIRRFADCIDTVVRILRENFPAED